MIWYGRFLRKLWRQRLLRRLDRQYNVQTGQCFFVKVEIKISKFVLCLIGTIAVFGGKETCWFDSSDDCPWTFWFVDGRAERTGTVAEFLFDRPLFRCFRRSAMKEVLTVILFLFYVYFIFTVLIRVEASVTLSFNVVQYLYRYEN
jgi:hypothetical protein